MLNLIRKRRHENEQFKLQGSDNAASLGVHSTIIAKMAAAKLASHIRKKIQIRKAREAEERAPMAADPSASQGASLRPDLQC